MLRYALKQLRLDWLRCSQPTPKLQVLTKLRHWAMPNFRKAQALAGPLQLLDPYPGHRTTMA
jgi:hypothetical protein